MHYKNGREAKNGDTILNMSGWPAPAVGVLFNATAGNDLCNGSLAVLQHGVLTPNLSDCYHIDDIKALLKGGVTVPDSSTTGS